MGRPKTRTESDKAFHFRMPRETWLLLKKASLIKEKSMSEICVEFIEKQRYKLGKSFDEIGEVGDVE